MPYNIAKWFLGFWNPFSNFPIDVFCISLQYAFRIYTVLNSVSKFVQQMKFIIERIWTEEKTSVADPGGKRACPVPVKVNYKIYKFHISFIFMTLRTLQGYWTFTVADLRGVRNVHPLYRSKFFHFHAVFSEILPNNMLLYELAPPLGNGGSTTDLQNKRFPFCLQCSFVYITIVDPLSDVCP